MLNISINTLRNWEQNRRKPEGPARVLLGIVEAHHDPHHCHPETIVRLWFTKYSDKVFSSNEQLVSHYGMGYNDAK